MPPFWSPRAATPAPSQRADRFVRALELPLPDAEWAWLVALGVPADIARREVRWAVRAVGLIVASRDALNDQTMAEVTHALDRVTVADAGWANRWSQYLEAHGRRGTGDSVARRLARVLLAAAGAADAPDAVESAAAFLTRQRVRLNGELGQAFGVAQLPEDRPPSAARG
jgi:hypothetical protein